VEPTVRQKFAGPSESICQHDSDPTEVEEPKQSSSPQWPEHWQGNDPKVEQVMGDEESAPRCQPQLDQYSTTKAAHTK
jgi:hypothetical protein